jgi:taurine---2-oxoglutarate transaminase
MEIIQDDQIALYCKKHNFWTWSAQSRVDPIPVLKAKGVYFWDVDGKRYLDFNSMVMCVNIGHGDDRVIQAITEQVQQLTYAGPQMATRPRAELGELLAEVCPPGIDHFLYTLGGADANENAIKLARAYTGRHKVITRYRSYHGSTYGAIALTGDGRRAAWEPTVMPGVVHMLDPFAYRSVFHDRHPPVDEKSFCEDHLNYLEQLIHFERPETISAILMESVTGTNGIIIPPAGYFEGVRLLCDKYGIVMIVDEVMAGFGRTGKWFGIDNWHTTPDIMTMAKGLTSGYAPLGAVGMKGKIAAFFNDRVYRGGLTYNGHPLSLAAAIANIHVIQQDHLIERSAAMGKSLSALLKKMEDGHPSVGNVRSIGLFGAIEIVSDRKTREPMGSYDQLSRPMSAIQKYSRENGLFHYVHDNIILIIPPLVITESELSEGFQILDRALAITDQLVGK